VAGVALAALAFALTAQNPPQPRSGYRDAYRAWRTGDAALEREAGAGGNAIAGRVQKAATAAAQYIAARKAFLEAWSGTMTANSALLEKANGAAGTESFKPLTTEYRDMVAAQAETLGRTIDTFKRDPDPGIQKLRQAMEREQNALTALSDAIETRGKAVKAGAEASAVLDRARAQESDQYLAMAAALTQVAGETNRQGDSLATYYKKLADVSRGVAAPAPVVPTPTAPAPSKAAPSGNTTLEAAPRPPSGITPLPLSRYTGAWIFPPNGTFMGGQPEFIDLVVHEDGGKASGTLFARFKLPPGSTGDPVLRFDFSGDFKNTRNQTFDLITSDGAAGTIELIPGSAFNLLEINFRTDAKPGKVRQGNVVLVKK
jgi:hypothetical protein